MTIETTYILKADEGKILRNKIDGIETPSVWLKIGDSKDDWEEIELPEEIDIPLPKETDAQDETNISEDTPENTDASANEQLLDNAS